MRTVLRSATAVAAGALTLLVLAATGQATASTHHVPRLSDTQARALHAQIRSGQARSTTHVLDYCQAHHLHCQAQLLARSGSSAAVSSFTPVGFGATDLESAYGLTGAGSKAATIAIVDAGAYPLASSDLGVYRRQYGLPACTKASGCLTVRTYDNLAERKPATSELGKEIEEEVGVETALDLDMASAACPKCKLLLLQLPPIDAAADSTSSCTPPRTTSRSPPRPPRSGARPRSASATATPPTAMTPPVPRPRR